MCVCSSWTLSVMAPSWLCQPARATTVAPRPPLLLRLSFTTRVYLFPQEAGGGTCTASGYSNLGCTRTDCNSWLRAFGSGLVLHELGHLTGFSHAQFDQDNNGLLSATEEMGDLSDPMTADG